MEVDRQGNDITASDMINEEIEEPSEIVEFFANSTIFITGATGYLGRLFMEKLLRTCNRLRRIYILVRPKKGKDAFKRFEEIFDAPCFETLKRKDPNFKEKLTLVNGDLCQPDLGLSEEDRNTLIAEVDCIIHCAATVRFDEKLRTAVNINIRSTRDLVHMARHMKKLRAMIHVSTAFSFCTRTSIDEVLYDVPIPGNKLLALVDLLDDDKLDKMTPIIMGECPNSYVFTKAVAEDIVRSETQNLPIAIFRPSIVIATVKEPVAGWIDNHYGATGIMVGAALGLLRSLHCKKELAAELVPADYVINSGLCAMWEVANKKSLNENKESKDHQQGGWEDKFEEDVPVYNYVSSPEAKLTWREFMRLAEKHAPQVPTHLQIWHYFFALRSNYYAHLLATFFYQTVPAYIVDFVAVCIGKKPLLVKGYQKIGKFSSVLTYFTMREWNYSNKNVQRLWEKLNKTDKRLFEFSMKNFNWDDYFYSYVRGGRVYLLKDPLSTLPEGRVKYYKLMAAHYALLTFLFVLLLRLVYLLFSWIF